jgi:hypothetical protein
MDECEAQETCEQGKETRRLYNAMKERVRINDKYMNGLANFSAKRLGISPEELMNDYDIELNSD